ncbi:RDH8 dehydrogenase, partial [Polyodon spathula]|nr:RDH8 dehydrogenase [Polyodon spathula]
MDSIPNGVVMKKNVICRVCFTPVSNTGMGLIGPIECQFLEEMKAVMDTNFFGLVRLLKEILPDLKRRKRGHTIVISSVMDIQGKQPTGYLLTLIEPCPVVTELEWKVYEEGLKTDLSTADTETASMFTNIYLKNCNQIFQSLGQTLEDIAEHTHKIITTDNPPFRHQTNKLYTPMTTLKYADPYGDLPIDTFYKIVFEHDKIFNASLNFIKILCLGSRKSFNLGKPQP